MDDGPAQPSPALVDETAAAIRARIMSGEIAIGAQLRQVELAAALGVSRTPVREALRQLQAGGLIEVVPHRGAVVRVPSPWEVREAYQVRAELEGLACQLAARRVDRGVLDELRAANDVLRAGLEHPRPASEDGPSPTTGANDRFHTLLHEVAGNGRLTRMIRDVNDAFPRNVSATVLATDARHRADNLAEHERIVAALAEDDAARARAEMQAHVCSAGEQLARWYEQRSATVYRG